MKANYIKPGMDYSQSMPVNLLDASNPTMPFDPEDPTPEALGKKTDILDYDWNNSMHYEIGQQDGNWFDALETWKTNKSSI